MSDTPPTDFFALSSLLTGFTAKTLVFAQQVADFYGVFYEVYGADAKDLMAVYTAKATAGEPPEKIAQDILTDTSVNETARALMIFWYLGQIGTADNYNALRIPTGNHYAQGLAWRAVQAHATGVSHLDFGYWKAPPPPLADFL